MPDDARVIVWALLLGIWLATLIVLGRGAEMITERSFIVFDSTVERFGLFTIIVLGEVVVAVVDGLTEADRDLVTIATGLFALVIGFGLWWNYFDLAGRRFEVRRPSDRNGNRKRRPPSETEITPTHPPAAES